MSLSRGQRLTDRSAMSGLTRHSDRPPSGRSPDRRGLLAAARRLFVQRGPDVTLREIAAEAGIDAGGSGCAGLAESFRAQRLGDLIDLVWSLYEPETHQRGAGDGPDADWTDRVREILVAHLELPRLSLRDVARTL